MPGGHYEAALRNITAPLVHLCGGQGRGQRAQHTCEHQGELCNASSPLKHGNPPVCALVFDTHGIVPRQGRYGRHGKARKVRKGKVGRKVMMEGGEGRKVGVEGKEGVGR